jgi:hypothetical protein
MMKTCYNILCFSCLKIVAAILQHLHLQNTRDYRLVSFGTSAVLLDAPRITLLSAIATSLCDAFTSIDHVHCGVPFLPL